MNEKEAAEIRRCFRPEKSNISCVRGCYVNEQKEIISEFDHSIHTMPEDEAEKFLSLLKRTLSGSIDRNLLNLEFSTQQVIESEEHKLLMALRDSSLKDENAVRFFFERVIQSVSLEDNYLILLAYENYDIPYRSKDGNRQNDASSEVFPYMLCSICPVKMSKPALSYHAGDNSFHSCDPSFIVAPPELGFMFPAFDDRSSNIYGSLYYTRNINEHHGEFVTNIFNCDIPMPAALQKETFQNLLSTTLESECDFEVVQAVHSQLQEMIEEHKVNKEPEPLAISKNTVRQILSEQGVSDTHVAAFEKEFDAQFGADMSLSPKNIVDTKQTEVTTPSVKIQISAERDDLVETRVINGTKYIMIRAEEGVELNGVPVQIK